MARTMKLVIFTAVLNLLLAGAVVPSDLQHKSNKNLEASLIRGPMLPTAREARGLPNTSPRGHGDHENTCRPTRCSSQSHSTTTETAHETTNHWTRPSTVPWTGPPTSPWTRPSTIHWTRSTTTTSTTQPTPESTTPTTTSTTPSGGGPPQRSSSDNELQRRDIAHHVKLGAEFLKRAARMTGTLDMKEDKKNLKLGAMERMSREILSYAETLSASLGTRTDSGTQRGSHLKSRPTCTVTSGYWDRECQCEFIHHHHHHHHHTTTTTPATTTTTTRRPKPTRPPRPSYPWHHEHYYPRPVEFYYPVPVHYHPEYPYWAQEHHHHGHHYHRPGQEQSVECIFQELHCLLETLSGHSHGPVGAGGIRGGEHGEHGVSKSPALPLVGKLQAMLSNQTLTRHLESSGGLEMKLFLTHKMADLDKMAMDQLGQDGAEQPLLQQLLHSLINKMEAVN